MSVDGAGEPAARDGADTALYQKLSSWNKMYGTTQQPPQQSPAQPQPPAQPPTQPPAQPPAQPASQLPLPPHHPQSADCMRFMPLTRAHVAVTVDFLISHLTR